MLQGGKRALAVIGCGAWGKNLVRVFNDLGVLRTACDMDSSKLDALAEKYPAIKLSASAAHVWADASIKAVAIATPAATHGALVNQALAAGKDVFVEKPLCLSVSQGRRLVRQAARSRRILMVGHILWYHSAVLKLAQMVRAGVLGKIMYIYSNRLNIGTIRREESILWSFAPHDISVILGLTGQLPSRVISAGGCCLRPEIADVTVCMFFFPGGIKAHVFVSWLHPFKDQKLVVVGDKSMAVFDDLAEDKLVVYPHGIALDGDVPTVSRARAMPVEVPDVEPLLAECRHFLNCVRTRRTPRTDGREALRVLSVLQQCQGVLQT